MGSSSPWAIEMVQNNKAGWTETVCIKCSANSVGIYTDFNGKGGAGWKVTQSPQPCSVQYSALSPAAQTFVYDKASGTKKIASSWSTFLTDNSSGRCSIKTCQLYEGGQCGVENKKLPTTQIESTTGGEITAKTDVLNGYSTSICVSCLTSDGHDFKYDNWKIKQVRDCSTSVQLVSQIALTPLVMPYSSVSEFN